MDAFSTFQTRLRHFFWPLLALAVILGLTAGVGAYTFVYAKGSSYLTDRPEACANCHVMNTVFEGWLKGGHQHVAVCNDCHVPHDFLGKWFTKADNGLHHSFAFTFKDIPLMIHAKARSQKVVQDNCLRCHRDMAQHPVYGASGREAALQCVTCHREAGHSH
jgi:cytochrome c nitrite reductase small subunit